MAKKLTFDKLLFTAVVLLVVLGLIMVYTSSVAISSEGDGFVVSRALFVRQAVAALIGLAAMVVAMQVDYQVLKTQWMVYLALGGVLALLVLVLNLQPHNNTYRWLRVGNFSMQPSELAKVMLVFFLAYQVDRKWGEVNRLKFLIPAAGTIALLFVLVTIEPDLGTATILLLVGGVMLFLGGLGWRFITVAGLVSLPVFWMQVKAHPYRYERMTAFFQNTTDPRAEGWQQAQSLIAVGSGGLTGVGLGQSGQKLRYLPEANSDFIFSILCEELGLIGGGLVLLLFAVFAWRGLRAGVRAPDQFGRHLAWGLTALVGLQALLHMSVTLRLLPVTGTPLPLLSYGGSSLVCSLFVCGMLLNVSQHAS